MVKFEMDINHLDLEHYKIGNCPKTLRMSGDDVDNKVETKRLLTQHHDDDGGQ